jgi:hypothetical protein
LFVNTSASEITPEQLGAAFKKSLGTYIARKRTLGSNYVLATSSDGVHFTPSLDNLVGKRLYPCCLYECSTYLLEVTLVINYEEAIARWGKM